MKETYIHPDMDIITFSLADIIATSDAPGYDGASIFTLPTGNGGENEGEPGDTFL
ncbi:MAG: hypothetical protein IJW45_03100 [Oscillospiraceae bacterium]|nr:hypothetical protein [Oscillospiraceae bacterium]